LKIRIFALAKELGIDSKDLIEYARQADIHIKNSALASISSEEKEIILNQIETEKNKKTSIEEVIPEVVEDSQKQSGKIRSIKKRMALTQKTASGSENVAVQELEPSVEDGNIVADSTITDEPIDSTADSTAVETNLAETETDQTATELSKEVGLEEPTVQPEEYVSLQGTGKRSIREMKMTPRGTLPGSNVSSEKKSKSKGKNSLPNLATPPNYKPPKTTPKKKEETAQKPDIPLTPDLLDSVQSPLRSHLRDKKNRHSSEPTGHKTTGRRDGTRTTGRDEHVDANQKLQKRRPRRRGQFQLEEDNRRPFARRTKKRRATNVVLKTEVEVDSPISVRSLSEAMGRPAKSLMGILFQQGQMLKINDLLDEETALDLARELGVTLTIKHKRDVEDELALRLETEDDADSLVGRPPVVTILGHVDHGKTTLLDTIRSGNVAAGEAGGITQHIAAYQIEHKGKKITFVDTPGHQAFSEMRSRGAAVTDIIILVVAADDGVMPQTVECISHAKSAGVPVIVAMNKIDLPQKNEEKVLQELSSHDILPSEWGGDIEVIRTSATTGEGVDELLETILLTAELSELHANPNRDALGVCLEATQEEGRGVLAWLIVQQGTLEIGDLILCGQAFGRIRAMYDSHEKPLTSAGPSRPVQVTGLNVAPNAGAHFFVMKDVEVARSTAESRTHLGRTKILARRNPPKTMEDILSAARDGEVQELPLIIKADTQGSLEALRSELEKFIHPDVKVAIKHEGIGGVNESDVSLANASGAIIIAFHVIPEDRAKTLAEAEGVEIQRYKIIYKVTETIRNTLEGLLIPEKVEVSTGRALVLRTFHISRYGTIAGCRVLNGKIERSNQMHVIREQTILNDYSISSLRREKDDAKEVREGMECGIRLEGFNDVKEGDILEAFRIDEVKRTLDS